MELKDFVSQAISQITEGVIEAQRKLSPSGALINPRMRHLLPQGEKNYASVGWAEGGGNVPVLMVNFDVAVTTTEGTKTSGGIGVVTGILSLGSTGASDRGNTAATRIAFQVPLMLPPHSPSTPGAA